MSSSFSVVILSGGLSVRMGHPKCNLLWDGSITFLEHIIRAYYQFGITEIVIVANLDNFNSIEKQARKTECKAAIALNKYPEKGKFYSLQLASEMIQPSKSAIIHNIDNPFVNQKLLTAMLKFIPDFDYVSPEYNGKGGHPFLISRKVIDEIKKHCDDETHLREFLAAFSRKKVVCNDKKILTNINTPEDYQEFLKSRD